MDTPANGGVVVRKPHIYTFAVGLMCELVPCLPK